MFNLPNYLKSIETYFNVIVVFPTKFLLIILFLGLANEIFWQAIKILMKSYEKFKKFFTFMYACVNKEKKCRDKIFGKNLPNIPAIFDSFLDAIIAIALLLAFIIMIMFIGVILIPINYIIPTIVYY